MLLNCKAIQTVNVPETIRLTESEQNAGRLHFVQSIESVMKNYSSTLIRYNIRH